MSNNTPATRWILGFDGGCCSCSGLARQVAERSNGKLMTRNLRDPEIAEWRKQALGDGAPWLPTLIRVEGEQVQAWTGNRFMYRLGRLLGPRQAWSLVQVLSRLGSGEDVASDPSRRRIVKGLAGASLAVALATGKHDLFSSATAASTWRMEDPDSNTAADMDRTFNSAQYRTFIRYLAAQGFNSTASDARKTAKRLVLHNATLVRKTKVAYYRNFSTSTSAILGMSIEVDNVPYWSLITSGDDGSSHRFELDSNGQVFEAGFAKADGAPVRALLAFPSFPFDLPSGCDICSTVCTGSLTRGYILGAIGCFGECSAASGFIGTPICAGVCAGLAGLAIGYIQRNGCPNACTAIGVC